MTPASFLDILNCARAAVRVAHTIGDRDTPHRAIHAVTEAGKWALSVDWPTPYHDGRVRTDIMIALDQLYRGALPAALSQLHYAECTCRNAISSTVTPTATAPSLVTGATPPKRRSVWPRERGVDY